MKVDKDEREEEEDEEEEEDYTVGVVDGGQLKGIGINQI